MTDDLDEKGPLGLAEQMEQSALTEDDDGWRCELLLRGAAAIRAYVAAVGEPVAVKPMGWDESEWPRQAQTVIGWYSIHSGRPDGRYRLRYPSFGHVVGPKGDAIFTTIDDAKAAAQADYEARIRSALAAPQPSQSRDEVVEALRGAFITCNSDGQAGRYEVVAKFRTLRKAQDAHGAIIRALSASPQREGWRDITPKAKKRAPKR